MKKSLLFLIVGLMGLVLIGCSGNLHDVPPRVNLSGGAIPGAFNGWKSTTSWTTADKENGKYTYEFKATAAEIEWKVLVKNGDWNAGSYCGNGTELVINVGEKKELVSNGDKNIKTTGLTNGKKYKVTIEATENTEVFAKIEAID